VDCDLHFRFENNILDGLSWVWCGIAILNVANGVVANNFVTRAAAGIHVVTVENMTIIGNEVQESHYGGIVVEDDSCNVDVKGNLVHNNEEFGIHVGNPFGSEDSQNIRIIDNIVYNNTPSGIRLLEADGCLVRNNTLYENYLNGIVVESGSHTIENNTITDCNSGVVISNGNCTITDNNVTGVDYGLSIGTENNTITGNSIAFNERDGIRFYHSSQTGNSGSFNTVTGNTIANNSRWGIVFTSESSSNLIHDNDFLMNGESGQACDDGSSNIINENFWDDWTEPDDDSNGFVDLPYLINGTATNSDDNPLASPTNPLPDWYLTPTTPDEPAPLEVDPMLIVIGTGGVVVVILLVVVLKKR
jgi:parallel beta-helix repeat protein